MLAPPATTTTVYYEPVDERRWAKVDCGVVDRRTQCMPVAHRWLNRFWAIQRMKLWSNLTLNLVSERMATFGLVFYSYRLQTIEVFVKSHVQTLIYTLH